MLLLLALAAGAAQAQSSAPERWLVASDEAGDRLVVVVDVGSRRAYVSAENGGSLARQARAAIRIGGRPYGVVLLP